MSNYIKINKKYCVYEHWYNNKCIYVGSGDKYRPFEFRQKGKWKEIFINKEVWDAKKFDVVNIVFETDNRDEAYKKEEEVTLQRIEEGFDLLNIKIGRKFKNKEDSPLYNRNQSKENNGFYGKKHSDETKRKIGEATKAYNEKYGHPSIGKRGAKAMYYRLYYKERFIGEFDGLKQCVEWCKNNIEGFPVKALRKLSAQGGGTYKATQTKYKKFDGYTLVKAKNKEDF